MRNILFMLTLLPAMTLMGQAKGHPGANDPAADRQAVEKVIERYIDVINTCDTALCGQIWSRGDEVSFIAPSGHYTSYEAIRDSLVVGLFGTIFTQRDLRKNSVKITVNGDNAWSEFYWTFDATRTDGKPHHARGLETQIFERSAADGAWRLVHIHYSSVR